MVKVNAASLRREINAAANKKLEEAFAFQAKALKLPPFETEYEFAARHVGLGRGIRGRLSRAGLKNWRFDFAWPQQKLAVEVEGGAFVTGRHTQGAGFTEDLLKYHKAMQLGWVIYRCDAKLIKTGEAVALVEALLKQWCGRGLA